jgi:hypothetical protein
VAPLLHVMDTTGRPLNQIGIPHTLISLISPKQSFPNPSQNDENDLGRPKFSGSEQTSRTHCDEYKYKVKELYLESTVASSVLRTRGKSGASLGTREGTIHLADFVSSGELKKWHILNDGTLSREVEQSYNQPQLETPHPRPPTLI